MRRTVDENIRFAIIGIAALAATIIAVMLVKK